MQMLGGPMFEFEDFIFRQEDSLAVGTVVLRFPDTLEAGEVTHHVKVRVRIMAPGHLTLDEVREKMLETAKVQLAAAVQMVEGKSAQQLFAEAEERLEQEGDAAEAERKRELDELFPNSA
ncbi:MAG: hypothetical protein DI629_12075 [Mesorhizobium amorphae]|nr:MAG: hypothetical protein DI629_12075 [Mesorhizobium amorphae]